MKVVQLIQRPQLRGAETFAVQLSREMEKCGHRSLVVVVFDATNRDEIFNEALTLAGDESKRHFDLSAWRRLAQIIKQEQPDIIQANAGDTLKYATLSKLFFRWTTPIVFRNASTISLYLKSPVARWWNSFLFSFTTHIVSVSEYSKKDFVRTFPKATNKVTVIPIAANVEKIVSKVANKNGALFFLHIGGFTFEKNHQGLISIFEKVVLKYPNARLALVGDGPLRNSIENLVNLKQMKTFVHFYGFQKNPGSFLEQADCLLLPSIIEGMPAVILEAFSYKVPVVAYDTGGISEIVKPHKTGWLVARNNEKEFVDAVFDVVEHPEKVETLTAAAYRLVTDSFGIKHVTSKFIDFYSQILGRGG